MSEERVVKRLYQNTAEGSSSVGRPRVRWMDDVREDLRRMGVTNWRIRAHRRDDWKMVVKEAKVLKGLWSHGIVVVVVVVVGVSYPTHIVTPVTLFGQYVLPHENSFYEKNLQ